MSDVHFVCYGIAAPQGSKVKTRFGMRESSKRLKPWRAQVSLAAAEAMTFHSELGEGTSGYRPMLEGPLRAHLLVVLPRPKAHFGTGKNAGVVKLSAPVYPSTTPDLDKCCRAIFDSMSGVVFRDDSQVASLHASKRYGEPARVEVSVATLEEEAA